ncbi:cobalamin-binding protein [Leptospira licerasiae]|uniref:Oligopeptide ABC transporter, oligopeptide-binding protein n=1 Tax=Leptospira licerasiae str. MMD4847 TaxID=1049971 RepID=A0ABN0HBP7_9LEPT|nr:cobalamin-binding protein [Leptospira licerasiae]EIE01832.1 oligopeptide ABC transporter, oligopeptide-binding protein [Leptospira licerasiae serovar Varillal str. VAR 010]EJZ43020.1 oligopeptide ABC transporter, oligopeptide-binding protein [Leptospira licerasiae str. MMD4847]
MSKIGPQRIVCLTEETTELLYLLGEEDRIVGISAYTERPPKAKEEKPRVSAFINGNIKRIKELEPDLVIGFSDIQAQLSHDLVKEGLNVLITNQRSLEEIFQTILMVGSLIGKSEQVSKLVESYKKRLNEIKERSSSKPKLKVFFQEWDHPIITGIRWVSELLEIVGAVDCFSHLKEKSLAKDRIISLHEVAGAKPDLIIGSWCGKPMDFEWVRTREEWKNIPAIRNDKIFEMDPAIILQPGPALFEEGVLEMNRILEEVRTSLS